MTNSKFELFTTTMTLTMTQQADPIWLGERRPCHRSGRLAEATAEIQTQKSYSAPGAKIGATEKLFWFEEKKANEMETQKGYSAPVAKIGY